MTTDFQAYQQFVSANPVVPFQLLTIPAAAPLPTFTAPTLGFNGLELHIGTDIGPVIVNVLWSVDGNVALDELVPVTWTLCQNTNLDVVIPAAANFVTITFQSGNASPATALVFATPVNTAYGGYRYLAPNPENIISENAFFAIGADQVFINSALAACDAWFKCIASDATGMLEFHVCTLTPSGTQGKILFKATPLSTSIPITQRMRLPALSCGVRVINNDGAAGHNGGFALIPAIAGT